MRRSALLVLLFGIALLVPIAVLAQSPTPTAVPPIEATPTFTHTPTPPPTYTRQSEYVASPTALPFYPSPVPSYTVTPTSTYLSYPTPFPTPTYIDPYQPTLIPSVEPRSIEFGERVNGTLSNESRYQSFTFSGMAGDVVVLNFAVPIVVPNILVAGSGYSGYPSVPPDASGNFVISTVSILPYSGQHQLIIDDYYNSYHPARDYTFTLSPEAAQPIEVGQTVEGELTTESPADLYEFEGQEGDLISMTAESAYVSAYVELVRRDGSEPQTILSSVSISGTLPGGRVVLPLFRIPQDGVYGIVVRPMVMGYPNPNEGEYRLYLTQLEVQTISLGETAEGALTTDTASLVYQFEAEAGDIIDLRVTTDGTIDTRLALWDSNGQPQTFDEDGGAGYDPEVLRFLIPRNGTYYAQISGYGGRDLGAVQLEVMQSPASSLNAGPQIIRSSRGSQWFTFDAQRRQRLRVTLEVVEGANTPNVIVSQNNQTLLNLPSSTGQRLTLEFVVPRTGRITLMVVPDYNNSTTQISVEPVSP